MVPVAGAGVVTTALVVVGAEVASATAVELVVGAAEVVEDEEVGAGVADTSCAAVVLGREHGGHPPFGDIVFRGHTCILQKSALGHTHTHTHTHTRTHAHTRTHTTHTHQPA